jgi:ECF transporter S component (folate family)
MQTLNTAKKSEHFSVRTMAGLALFCALYVVLQSVTVNLSPTLRISFSFLALAASCMCYGLVPNLVMAFAADLLGFLVHPDGTYLPFFAFILMIKAAIYSFFLYKKPVSAKNIVAAQFIAVLVCNVLLNPLALSLLYQSPFWVLLTSRLVKNALLFPIECGLLYLVCMFVQKNFLKKLV